MEKRNYYIKEQNGHNYNFKRYRGISFNKSRLPLIVLQLYVQYEREKRYKKIEVILRTIKDTNIKIIRDLVDIINAKISNQEKAKA